MARKTCLYCIHRIKPKVQRYLYQEICEVSNSDLDSDDVPNMVCDDFKGTEFYEKFKDK